MYADPIHSASCHSVGNTQHVPLQSFHKLQLSSATPHITSSRESNTQTTTVLFVLF